MHRISREHIAYRLDKEHAPILAIDPGQTVAPYDFADVVNDPVVIGVVVCALVALLGFAPAVLDVPC